ncbi:unnamed protein product [Ceratitis capitata]|uniref:(Mediterranean fruit fly) hypothetical protein n=1 Tax=Ceratitis capitata TaxID=7213 RepID=A0A811UZC3_CERCA|nr:unnamed protein product [Ceratitis capitata]
MYKAGHLAKPAMAISAATAIFKLHTIKAPKGNSSVEMVILKALEMGVGSEGSPAYAYNFIDTANFD